MKEFIKLDKSIKKCDIITTKYENKAIEVKDAVNLVKNHDDDVNDFNLIPNDGDDEDDVNNVEDL